MRSTMLKTSLIKSGLAASLLLVANGVALAQSTVTLTAAPTTTTLPDGQTVPMWGYACGAVSGTGVSGTAANGAPQLGGVWQRPLITRPRGLHGVLVVTDADQLNYPGQPFDAAVALLLSEIDPVQNTAVDTAVRTAGFSDALVWSGQTGKCGDPAVHTCYPPAVNYDPRYYLINGVSFDRTSLTSSVPAVPAAAPTGRVLLRFVHGGPRMPVPAGVGANPPLLSAGGHKLPGISQG